MTLGADEGADKGADEGADDEEFTAWLIVEMVFNTEVMVCSMLFILLIKPALVLVPLEVEDIFF